MPTKSFNLKEKLEVLQTIEKQFASGDVSIESALKEHARALAIAKEIFEYLDSAESSLEVLSKSA